MNYTNPCIEGTLPCEIDSQLYDGLVYAGRQNGVTVKLLLDDEYFDADANPCVKMELVDSAGTVLARSIDKEKDPKIRWGLTGAGGASNVRLDIGNIVQGVGPQAFYLIVYRQDALDGLVWGKMFLYIQDIGGEAVSWRAALLPDGSTARLPDGSVAVIL